MALVYQNAGAAQLRSTLAGFFVLGTTISVVALWGIGRFGVEEAWLALLLCPAMAGGFFLAGPLRRRVSDRAIRPLVLGLSLVAAAVVLVAYASVRNYVVAVSKEPRLLAEYRLGPLQ